MRLRTKKVIAAAVSRVPGKAVRRQLYGLLPGYRIAADVSLGYGVTIAVDSFVCERGVTIRRGTSFTGPIAVELGEGTFIGRWNRFDCGNTAADPAQARMNYARRLTTGRKCLINESHLFDLLGHISVGEGTWIAGFGSQFLTHGASVMDRDIHIGENCFVGSAVRFAPGSSVGHRVMVGMGAVVTKPIPDSDVVVGGLPAKVIRQRETSGDYLFERTW